MINKLEIVEKAMWEGVVTKSDAQIVVEKGWVQQTTPYAPTAFLNGVYRCEIDDDSIVDRVRETVAHYRSLKLPFRWKVGPLSRPAHLRSLLIENGMALKETLFGLIADPRELKIPVNPAVRVEAVSLENLEDWLSVQAKAWHVPPPGIAHQRQTMTQALERGDQVYLNFLAYLNEEPVASAALRFYPEYAFLQGAATNPERRGQGVYRSLLAHRLEIIGQRGLPAVIHCLETTSAPICLKLGFEKVCEIHSFEPVAPV